MPQARSHERAQKQCIKQRIQNPLVNILPFEELGKHPVAQDKARHEEQTIPPDGE